MSTPTADRPEISYTASGGALPAEPALPPGPPLTPEQPAGLPRRDGRRGRRAAALLLAGAVVGASTGAATAQLLDDDGGGSPAPVTRAATTAVAPAARSGSAEAAAAAISPSVVTLTTSSGQGATGATGTGSGIVLDTDGHVVTNAHVVAGAGRVTVTLQDGRSAEAAVVGTDVSSDLAVVRVRGLEGLVPAVFADSDALRVGQGVLAVGAPLGLANTVTQGIVSTLERPVRTGGQRSAQTGSEQSVLDAVQTDAPINPGNSGGALVDLAGHVVGIPSAIATAGDGSSGNIGVGFAIPSNDAAEVADELIADGTADHARLGVSVEDATGAGAVLSAVTPSGSAARAGLRVGDVVTAVGERTVTDADSLIVAVRDGDPGDTVTVTYRRDGERRTAEATLTSSRP